MIDTDLSKLKIDRGAARPVARRRRGPLLWIVLAAAVAGGAWFAFARTGAKTVEVATVTTAWPSQAHTLLNATGYVVAQRKAAVASKATGRLDWLGVAEGSRVKKGEIIARLESSDVRASASQAAAGVDVARANVGQAEAELRDAERAMRRSQDLLAKQFISQSAHDSAVARFEKARAAQASAKASVAAAEASRRVAQIAVEQTEIAAPFDAVVLTKNANVGDVVTPFSSALDTKGAVVTVADMGTLEVEADVSESNLAQVKVGQPVEIQLDAIPGIRLRGVVARIVPTVDRAKATVMTKIRFLEPDPRILPEMSAKVAFLSKEPTAEERTPRTAVQAAALATRDGRPVLFRIESDTAVPVPVETGARLGDLVEVKGVKAGEKVVLRPPEDLHAGDKVRQASK